MRLSKRMYITTVTTPWL